MPLGQYKRGVTSGDRRIHAAVRKLSGSYALCGAGRIHVPMSGQFDTSEFSICGDCALRVQAEPVPE